MRITSTLTILSIAALASAHVLRNIATGLCLDVDGDGDMVSGTPLIMTSCHNLRHGDWSIEVVGDKSALIKNTETIGDDEGMCVLFSGDQEENAILLPCFLKEARLNRVKDTSHNRWSFSMMFYGEELALSARYSEGSRVQFLPVKSLQGDRRQYEWSKKPEDTMYKKLYSWMRFQGR
ncbi:hypothetical protein BGZ72_010505 [Mortierella alpina]|nr:hypothetical protein BGZ72_010505 [Mortierella alpina]